MWQIMATTSVSALQHLFLNHVVQVLICHKLAYTTGCKARIVLRDGVISWLSDFIMDNDSSKKLCWDIMRLYVHRHEGT